MAIVIDSVFKPLTYDEIVKPLMLQTLALLALEDAYNTLLTLANTVETMANELLDPIAYKRYKDYTDSLRAKVNQLYEYGLSLSSKLALGLMKARYASDIVPILEAYKTRGEQAKALLEALVKDPTHMFARQASTISLDDYLANKLLDVLSENYSGALLTSLVAQKAQALAKELSAYGKGKPIDAYTDTFLKQHGFTSSLVLDAINNPNRESSLPVLNALVESTVDSSGIKGWNDLNLLNKAYNYARQGLWSAVGPTDISPIENYKAKEALRHRNAMTEANPNLTGTKGYDPNAAPLYSKSEIAKRNKDIANKIKEFKKAGFINSKDLLTVAGLKEYRKSIAVALLPVWMDPKDYEAAARGLDGRRYVMSRFRQFINSLGYTPTGRAADLSKYISKTIRNLASGDAPIGTLNTDVYRTPINEIQSKSLANMISALAGTSKIYSIGKVQESAKGSLFPVTITLGQEKLSGEAFRKKVKDYPIVAIENAGAANQQMVLLADGSRYLLPEGVYSSMAKSLITSANLGAVNAGSTIESYVNTSRALAYAASPIFGTEQTDIDRGGSTVNLAW